MPGLGTFCGGGGVECSVRGFRVDRKQIGFIRFIFEGYDGMLSLRTVDATRGAIRVYIAPGCEEDAEKILAGLAECCPMQEIR